MSRYYSIELGDGTTYSSQVGGQNDPNALNVDLDLSIVEADTPGQGCYVRIWGVGLQKIAKANALFNKSIVVRGGMAAGLPLANPAQAGILAQGLIVRPFGNWYMTEQTLDLMFSASSATNGQPGSNPKPANNHIVFNWKKGAPLQGALQQALQTAFQGFNLNINLSKQIVAPMDHVGYYANIQQFAEYLRRYSQQLIGGGYDGVSIAFQNGAISVFDSGQSGAGQISYTDLVCQPMWIEPQKIQIRTVMRADIKIGALVTLPKTWVNSSSEGAATVGSDAQSVALQGKFKIVAIRHVGNFRAPSGDAWVTNFEAIPA